MTTPRVPDSIVREVRKALHSRALGHATTLRSLDGKRERLRERLREQGHLIPTLTKCTEHLLKALAAASAGEADAVLAGYFAAAATAEVLTHAGNKAILQRALEAKDIPSVLRKSLAQVELPAASDERKVVASYDNHADKSASVMLMALAKAPTGGRKIVLYAKCSMAPQGGEGGMAITSLSMTVVDGRDKSDGGKCGSEVSAARPKEAEKTPAEACPGPLGANESTATKATTAGAISSSNNSNGTARGLAVDPKAIQRSAEIMRRIASIDARMAAADVRLSYSKASAGPRLLPRQPPSTMAATLAQVCKEGREVKRRVDECPGDPMGHYELGAVLYHVYVLRRERDGERLAQPVLRTACEEVHVAMTLSQNSGGAWMAAACEATYRKLADMYNGMARAMRGTDIGDGAATDTRTASP